MRFTLAFVVLVAAVMVTVSAAVQPARAGSKTAGTAGRTKDEAREDDRFHLQSPDGQYVFGHTTGNQGRAEMRAKDGTITGYYSYVTDNGRVVYVNYVADKNGYRVLSNAGVPSASVTVVQENGFGEKSSGSENDFQKVFSDFTRRIEKKVVGQVGQTSVVTDPMDEGQRQVVVQTPTLYPSKETKPSRHGERDSFPNWDQVKMSTTQKTTDGIKHNEGQQQQELINPIWDNTKITTQKSNIKGKDNDGQGSFENSWTAEKDLKPIPLVPYHPQESTTEVAADSRFGSESTVTIEGTQNNSPVTKYASTTNEFRRTTVIPYDRIAQTTEGYFTQTTTAVVGSVVQQSKEASTGQVISESATVHNRIADENEEKTEDPLDGDRLQQLTTVRSLDQNEDESFENVVATTEQHQTGVVQTDFQTTAAEVSRGDYTTVKTVEEKCITPFSSSTPSSTVITTASYQFKMPEDSSNRFNGSTETDTAAGIQHVTEQNKDGFEFRTLEPTEIIGTTVKPAATYDFRPSDEVAQVQEIVWPEIPQEPIPQVLVPLDPYPEESQHRKNEGVKTQSSRSSRPVRHFESTEVKSNGTETTTYHDDENGNMFNFPRYFLTVG